MSPIFSEPPPEPSPPPVGRPDRRALLQAYQEVVRTTKSRPSVKRALAPDKRPYWIAVSVTIAFLTFLLVFQPPWMFNRPPAEPPQLREASLRVRMYVEIDRVERFKQAKGRLPANLAEAGGDSTSLTFEPRGEGYILSGQNGPIALRYTSGSSPEAFLGNSYQLIRARGK